MRTRKQISPFAPWRRRADRTRQGQAFAVVTASEIRIAKRSSGARGTLELEQMLYWQSANVAEPNPDLSDSLSTKSERVSEHL